jgi:hypothetical protein
VIIQDAALAPSHRPLLIARSTDDPRTREAHMSNRPVLLAVARRSLPQLAEATVIPAILFYCALVAIGPGVAMVVALGWAYLAVIRRLLRGERPPAVLLLATCALSARTVAGLLSGSTFVYFIQPVASTVILAGVFLGSVAIGRPVVARIADDFCPIAPEVARRPAVTRLFAGLTVLWAAVHLLTASVTFAMLVSMPVAPFVAVKTTTCLAITIVGVVVTVCWSVRTARREDLVFAGVLA